MRNMSAMLKLFLVVTQLVVVLSELPPVQKCALTDAACLKSSAQEILPAFVAGMPEIGAEILDPMKIDTIKVDLAGLKMNLDTVVVKGLRKAVIDKISVDMAKKQMLASWDTDIVLKGHYKASGRLLILPITGDGEMTIKLKKLHIDMTINFEMGKTSDGKDMIDLKNYKYKFDVKENAHFGVTGLFGGNRALSDPMLRFMNENWQILAHEFGQPMLEKPNKKIFESMQAFFRAQAMENLANVI